MPRTVDPASPKRHGSNAGRRARRLPWPAASLIGTMLVLGVAACEPRTVVDPGSATRATELGMKPRAAAARGADYATKELVPGRGIGDLQLQGATLADVERVLGTDYQISSLSTTQDCGPDGCREGATRFSLEYRRLALTVGFERAAAGTPVEQSRVRLFSVFCADPRTCAWRGSTSLGLRIGDGDDRAVELHGGGRKLRGTGNRVYAEGLSVAFGRQGGAIESLTVFRPEDIKQFQ